MPTQSQITVFPIGLTNIDLAVLKVAISLLVEKGNLKVTLSNTAESSIVVTDVDTPGGQDFYEHFNSKSGQAMLVLSEKILNDQRNIVLKKPVRVQSLRDILYDIIVDFLPKSNPIASSSKEQPITSNALKNTLFSVLLKAQQEKHLIQVFCSPYPPLYVDVIQQIVATSASRDLLRKIVTHQGTLKSTKLSPSDFEVFTKGQLIIPFTRLLWNAALYGSHGQLIEGHSLDTPVQLKAWPNFSRLEFEPEHLRLAATMANQPLTLKQIQQKLEFSWETIIGFYNAAWATDLMIISPKTLPVLAHRKPDKVSLLSKIAKRLKLAFQ